MSIITKIKAALKLTDTEALLLIKGRAHVHRNPPTGIRKPRKRSGPGWGKYGGRWQA